MLLLAAIASACGVNFTAEQGNDFFRKLDVTGEMVTGAPLTASVYLQQRYPISLVIRCEVLKDNERVTIFPQDIVPEHPAGGPTATPFTANYSYTFSVNEPGRYIIECFTTRDEDNFIGEAFNVRAAPTPTPPPTPAP